MYKEKNGDIFYDVMMMIDSAGKVKYSEPKNVIYAQCVSCDCAMGAGISVRFNQLFNIKNNILQYLKEEQEAKISSGIPNLCEYYYVNPVINFFTKVRYWHKPTEEDFKIALSYLPEAVRHIKAVDKCITEVRMPMIGTGLDRLSWNFVKKVLQEQAKELDKIGVDLVVIDKRL